MKVFLSYASEDHHLAEQVAHSLRGRSHTVFFDRSDLPPGGNFEQQIEKAIGGSSLMIFLISPDSVADGRFTLTELKIAQARWKSAENRVLPVMLRPTPKDAVPNYLRAVTILEPEGSAPAEIAQEVDRLAKHWGRFVRSSAIVVVSGALVVVMWWYFSLPQAAINLRTEGPEAYERGFFGKPDLYRIGIIAKNDGLAGNRILRFSLDVEPEGALIQHRGGSGFNAEEPEIVAPGFTLSSHILVSIAEGNEMARWRACAHMESGRPSCTPFVEYEPKGELLYGDRFELDEHLTQHTTAVAWDGETFLVAAKRPNRMVRLTENGSIRAKAAIEGVPTSISIGNLGVFVGLAMPDKIVRLDSETLEVKKEFQVEFPNNSSGQPVSSRPANLAQDGENLWVISRGGASANGLGVLDADLTMLHVPPYYEKLSFDLPGMTLRSGDGSVWSGDNNTSPSSIKRLTTADFTQFGGHDYEIASCADDVLPIDSALLVPDCDGWVYVTNFKQDQIKKGRRLDRILEYRNNAQNWPVVLFGKTVDDRYVAAVTISDRGSRYGHTVLSTLNWDTKAKMKLAVHDARVLDMAVGRRTSLLIIENGNGATQLVSPSLD